MSELQTARARIREAMIDTMDESELRSLVGKTEAAIDGGWKIDEETLEEHIGEIISTRDDVADTDELLS